VNPDLESQDNFVAHCPCCRRSPDIFNLGALQEAEKREKTARLEYRLDLDEVSSRLVGAHQKMQRKGVVAVKVQHFSFADEALERAIPPPPRFPHKPQKKVQKNGLKEKKGVSRGGSIWDEKSGGQRLKL
jgi:hypothetical protein